MPINPPNVRLRSEDAPRLVEAARRVREGRRVIAHVATHPGQDTTRCVQSRRLKGGNVMTIHKVGTREEWQAARDELLAEEKELTRRNDELARKRRELPWVPVDEEYTFETDEGAKSLAELFDGRSQLLIYHFIFGPTYEAGCTVCSSITD